MKVYQNITELIGRTPLLELKNYTAKEAYKARIFAKLEYFNPAGSVKDRIAYIQRLLLPAGTKPSDFMKHWDILQIMTG